MLLVDSVQQNDNASTAVCLLNAHDETKNIQTSKVKQ